MPLGSQVRRAGFWLLDEARGSPIRRHLDDIRARMGDDVPSDGQLRRLLDHAVATTSFYSRYAGRDLGDFPVVNKTTYRSHMPDLRSSAYAGAPLRRVTTTGSTGMAVTFMQDQDKRRRNIADVIHHNELHGQRVGDRLLWIHNWTASGGKSMLRQMMENVIPMRVIGLDESARRKVIRLLESHRADVIQSYSSVLLALAAQIERDRLAPHHFGLRAAVSDSEGLLPAAKSRIEAALGCPVVDRYGNNENGILAVTKIGDVRFGLNTASYRFEFLKLDTNEPEAPGRMARLVLTDLYSFATPFIRYDTGDLVVVSDDPRPTLLRLEGRQAELLRSTSGLEVSSTSVAFVMEGFQGMTGYQLTQEGTTRFRLRVAQAGTGYTAMDFARTLSGLLGPDAHITVEFVERIPPGPGGKQRTVVGISPSRDGWAKRSSTG